MRTLHTYPGLRTKLCIQKVRKQQVFMLQYNLYSMRNGYKYLDYRHQLSYVYVFEWFIFFQLLRTQRLRRMSDGPADDGHVHCTFVHRRFAIVIGLRSMGLYTSPLKPAFVNRQRQTCVSCPVENGFRQALRVRHISIGRSACNLALSDL